MDSIHDVMYVIFTPFPIMAITARPHNYMCHLLHEDPSKLYHKGINLCWRIIHDYLCYSSNSASRTSPKDISDWGIPQPHALFRTYITCIVFNL